MNYLTIELQTNDGVTSNIVTQYNELKLAESAFYSVCSSAIISSVEVHAIILMDENGIVIKNEFFKHESG